MAERLGRGSLDECSRVSARLRKILLNAADHEERRKEGDEFSPHNLSQWLHRKLGVLGDEAFAIFRDVGAELSGEVTEAQRASRAIVLEVLSSLFTRHRDGKGSSDFAQRVAEWREVADAVCKGYSRGGRAQQSERFCRAAARLRDATAASGAPSSQGLDEGEGGAERLDSTGVSSSVTSAPVSDGSFAGVESLDDAQGGHMGAALLPPPAALSDSLLPGPGAIIDSESPLAATTPGTTPELVHSGTTFGNGVGPSEEDTARRLDAFVLLEELCRKLKLLDAPAGGAGAAAESAWGLCSGEVVSAAFFLMHRLFESSEAQLAQRHLVATTCGVLLLATKIVEPTFKLKPSLILEASDRARCVPVYAALPEGVEKRDVFSAEVAVLGLFAFDVNPPRIAAATEALCRAPRIAALFGGAEGCARLRQELKRVLEKRAFLFSDAVAAFSPADIAAGAALLVLPRVARCEDGRGPEAPRVSREALLEALAPLGVRGPSACKVEKAIEDCDRRVEEHRRKRNALHGASRFFAEPPKKTQSMTRGEKEEKEREQREKEGRHGAAPGDARAGRKRGRGKASGSTAAEELFGLKTTSKGEQAERAKKANKATAQLQRRGKDPKRRPRTLGPAEAEPPAAAAHKPPAKAAAPGAAKRPRPRGRSAERGGDGKAAEAPPPKARRREQVAPRAAAATAAKGDAAAAAAAKDAPVRLKGRAKAAAAAKKGGAGGAEAGAAAESLESSDEELQPVRPRKTSPQRAPTPNSGGAERSAERSARKRRARQVSVLESAPQPEKQTPPSMRTPGSGGRGGRKSRTPQRGPKDGGGAAKGEEKETEKETETEAEKESAAESGGAQRKARGARRSRKRRSRGKAPPQREADGGSASSSDEDMVLTAFA